MPAVNPVEPGHVNPIVAKESLHAFVGHDEVRFPFDARKTGIFESAEIFFGLVGGGGGRIGSGRRTEGKYPCSDYQNQDEEV